MLTAPLIYFSVQCSACQHFKLFNGLHSINPSIVNARGSDLLFARLSPKFPSSDNAVCRIKATLTSGGGDLRSHPNSSDAVKNGDLLGVESVGTEVQPNAVAFGTLGADTALTSNGFSDDNDEFDLDSPTEGFASIPEAIEDIWNGKVAKLSLSVDIVLLLFFFP